MCRDKFNRIFVKLPKKRAGVIEKNEIKIADIEIPIMRVINGIIMIFAAITAVFSWFIWNRIIGKVII